MRANKALRAWREKKATVGGWLSIGNAYTAEVMANLGFDWLCVDLQHGLIDYQDLTAMLPAISTTETTPIVRVPWNEPYEIMKALDAGAYGVIVPMVNNREEALRAVSACRYPPARLALVRSDSRGVVWRPRIFGGSERRNRLHRDDRNRRSARKPATTS